MRGRTERGRGEEGPPGPSKALEVVLRLGAGGKQNPSGPTHQPPLASRRTWRAARGSEGSGFVGGLAPPHPHFPSLCQQLRPHSRIILGVLQKKKTNEKQETAFLGINAQRAKGAKGSGDGDGLRRPGTPAAILVTANVTPVLLLGTALRREVLSPPFYRPGN